MRWLSLLLLAACDGGPTVTELVDVGEVCIDSQDGSYVVDFQTCLSSSCDTLVSAECSGTLDGDTLTITATAVIESEGNVCTDDCGFVQASCELPTLSDTSNLTVVYGEQSGPFQQLSTCGF